MCVQHSLDSRNSAIHSAYRILRRPSSLLEPRHPSLKVVKICKCNFKKADGKKKVSIGASPPRLHVRALTPMSRTQVPNSHQILVLELMRVNDPSAGSPTETLLRLLLPLSDKVHGTSRSQARKPKLAAVRTIHRITQSVGATGGVYKGQKLIQCKIMTHTYKTFIVKNHKFQ